MVVALVRHDFTEADHLRLAIFNVLEFCSPMTSSEHAGDTIAAGIISMTWRACPERVAGVVHAPAAARIHSLGTNAEAVARDRGVSRGSDSGQVGITRERRTNEVGDNFRSKPLAGWAGVLLETDRTGRTCLLEVHHLPHRFLLNIREQFDEDAATRGVVPRVSIVTLPMAVPMVQAIGWETAMVAMISMQCQSQLFEIVAT